VAQIENLVWVVRTQKFHQDLEGFLPLLFGGLENRGEHLLSARASFRTVPSPVLARTDQRSDGSLAYIVGGIQAGTIEESEQVRPLMEQTLGQPTVGRISARARQHAIEFDFPPSGGGPRRAGSSL